jgi:hypothetical protein
MGMAEQCRKLLRNLTIIESLLSVSGGRRAQTNVRLRLKSYAGRGIRKRCQILNRDFQAASRKPSEETDYRLSLHEQGFHLVKGA